MKDLSYHILDIVQNSLHAGSTSVCIEINERSLNGILELNITDNGKGMDADMVKRVSDPFFTTSVTKKVGLGLPLLRQNAERTGGSLVVVSDTNRGTRVTATFMTGSIDLLPLGDTALTFRMLVASNPGVDFTYRHIKDDEGFELSTADLRSELGIMKLNDKEVLDYMSEFILNNLKAISVQLN